MNLPNKLTIARVIAVPVFVILYKIGWIWPAGIVYILACLTDTADGYIARKQHITSNFGKIMDPLADKVLVYSAFCIFIEDHIIPSWMLMVILAREFIVAGVRAVAASQGNVIAAAWSGKIKTILQMIAVPMIVIDTKGMPGWWHVLSMIMLWASFIMTIYSGFEYTYKNREVFK